MNSKHQTVLFITMLAAQAVVISLVERLIPTPFSFAPGAKLGLGNLISLIAIFTLPARDSVKVVSIRLLISTFLGGTFSTFLYGFAGVTLSYIGMLSAKQLGPNRVSAIGISILGGMLHNIGQLLVFALIGQSLLVLNYLPILSFTGILSGFLVGLTANYLLQKVGPLRHYNQIILAEWK
ncbi:heptaprenyl diphosphate synthase [Streptococcus sp. zg-86]|uniref:Heptaprenyl diphosphate synthase n=1 Tax=Streptococcus zhangguiae TaxID=2664091 RepID=A0A6I4RIL6_9STRE|nr:MULTISPECIES: Gx transporter family protein [Streptococcus]MTB64352.1 heptaprenyl diphosphate synthase [Streptococcus sp. zg-86]MTB90662.1 heptaprenyl diphosphate synthase [Streptococcus sp. zg-36]MWV56343.1 heptaprenyl diphosphate synthase [Streptococcus sp. zg-70]QTH47445.1 Gx transporter family protein [Streptococcus sp. zg-86]